MKSSKTFNNISDELLKSIPKLKSGQSVIFQMTNGVPNPEPDEKERSKDPILYPKVQLMTKFRIFDKHKDEYVDVGCAESWKGEEPTGFRCFVAGSNPANARAAMPSRFQGKFELKGGNVRDEELYEILWLSPQREGTPCPDANVEQIFKIVDAKADSRLSLNKFDILKKALDLVKDIKEEKAREVMAALLQPTYQDKDVLMAKIKDFASSKPQDFIDTYESAETPIKATIKEAMDAGVLSHDIATGEVKLGGVKLIDFKTEDPTFFVPEFAKFINTAANGKDVITNIKSRLKKKEEVK